MANSPKPPPYPGPGQSSYPPASGGYPTRSTGYPPGSVGYTPGTTGYPLGPAGYPPGTTGYPLGPAGYPPGTTAYPLGPAGYPPGTIGYQPYAYGPNEVVFPPPGAGIAPADDNLFLSALSCFCCPIIGVVAILYSCQARAANKRCDYERARRYGATALRIAVVALVAAGIWVIVVIVVRLVKKYK